MIQTYHPILPLRRLYLHNAPKTTLVFVSQCIRKCKSENTTKPPPLPGSPKFFPPVCALKLQPEGQVLGTVAARENDLCQLPHPPRTVVQLTVLRNLSGRPRI